MSTVSMKRSGNVDEPPPSGLELSRDRDRADAVTRGPDGTTLGAGGGEAHGPKEALTSVTQTGRP